MYSEYKDIKGHYREEGVEDLNSILKSFVFSVQLFWNLNCTQISHEDLSKSFIGLPRLNKIFTVLTMIFYKFYISNWMPSSEFECAICAIGCVGRF